MVSVDGMRYKEDGMDILLMALMVLLGLIGSFFSGLLGIGGAIISYPLLLFVPSALGLAYFTAQEVSSISMFQVLFASLAGVLALRRSKKGSALIHKPLVLYMGASTLVGSLIGAYGSKFMDEGTINIVYGVLAIVAVVLMLIPSRGSEEDFTADISFSKGIAIAAAFAVGIVSGVVGAGGAFILIPIMLTVLKIPTRITIASSLAIVFISALGGVAGKLMAGHILLLPALLTIAGSLLGAPIGSSVSSKIDVKYLRYALVVLISLTAVKVWMTLL